MKPKKMGFPKTLVSITILRSVFLFCLITASFLSHSSDKWVYYSEVCLVAFGAGVSFICAMCSTIYFACTHQYLQVVVFVCLFFFFCWESLLDFSVTRNFIGRSWLVRPSFDIFFIKIHFSPIIIINKYFHFHCDAVLFTVPDLLFNLFEFFDDNRFANIPESIPTAWNNVQVLAKSLFKFNNRSVFLSMVET